MHSATPDSPPMFESKLIDFFSRTHWSAIPIVFGPAALVPWIHGVYRVELGWTTSLLLALAGFSFWTLSEYWLHRLFFHWQPPGAWGERMHFLAHGVHHRWPKDRYRLVMPPAVGISTYLFSFLVFSAVFGSWVWGFHPGFVLGYVFYDLTHYYLHHGHPKSERMKRLRRHHMLHHFRSQESRFGVSNMFWDGVFGTAQDGGPSRARDLGAAGT